MITNELIDLINSKLEEVFNICQANNLPMVSVVFAPEMDDHTIFMGGQNQDLSLMVAEIIANVTEDMKGMIKSGTNIEPRELVSLFMGDVAQHLEVYLASEGGQRPRINEAVALLSEKIEKEIDDKLKEVLVGPPLTKELVLAAESAALEILTKYSLEEKISYNIKIMPDGTAEATFQSKKRTEGLH